MPPWPSSSPHGPITFPLPRALPTPTCPTTGTTPDVFNEAPTLAALAERLGMDAAALQRSAQQGPVRPLGDGPYVALGPVRSVFVHSEGGLAVDLEHRVLNASGAPIAGLYAAGSTGQGGLLLRGHGHHLAWAFVSGRRAGRFAAQNGG